MTELDALREVESHLAKLRDDDVWLCVPDLHGHFMLANVAAKILKHTRFQGAVLGDMIDRGPDSVKTVEIIRRLKTDKPSIVTIKGNHCQMLLDLVNDMGIPTGWATDPAFADEAAYQYGLQHGCIPAEHLTFLELLEVFHQGKNITLVHGGVSSPEFINFPVEKIPANELMWSYGTHRRWSGSKFVCGHTLVDFPVETNVAIHLDSGAWMPGRSNAKLTIGIVDDRDDVFHRLLGWIEISKDTLAAKVVWARGNQR